MDMSLADEEVCTILNQSWLFAWSNQKWDGYTRKRKETLIIMLQAKFYIYIHVINTCIAKFFYILFIVYVSVNLYFFTAVDF